MEAVRVCAVEECDVGIPFVEVCVVGDVECVS